MRSIKSDLEHSRYPLKLAIHPSPSWKRKRPAPGPQPGPRLRRSDKVDADAEKRTEKAQGNSDKGES